MFVLFLMHFLLHISSSSSSDGTPVASAFELKARDLNEEHDIVADKSHSVSSKQTIAPASSPDATAEVHVSKPEHYYPVAPEPRVNYL